MNPFEPFYVQKGSIFAVPITHYTMEMACQVKLAFDTLKPDCVAVELPQTMQPQMLHAASRLPDISLVLTHNQDHSPVYFMCEPADPIFEAIRSGLENQIDTYCIDLDVDHYPEIREAIPDAYAIQRIGLKNYYEIYCKTKQENRSSLDRERELYMARQLKELSLRYDRILFVGGMAHIAHVLASVDLASFPTMHHADREAVDICTLTEESCREVMAEWGYLSKHYEEHRSHIVKKGPLDRQKVMLQLYKEASEKYTDNTGLNFPGYHLRNIMKFVRNYAFIHNQLMPDLFKILTAAKGCVDHNYAYETWELATDYPYRKNIDGLPELHLTISEVWGESKHIQFHLKEKGKKNSPFSRTRKDRSNFRFKPPSPFGICSYPPEDVSIEKFGKFLQKKGYQLLLEESSRSVPFSTGLEDGIDTRETIRHWYEKKLFVKIAGKPPSGVGSICVIFDEDKPQEGKSFIEKYPWRTTWIGEHNQESDMAFYSTPIAKEVIGPGISRCEYGGFMMSYPPRRLVDVWHDPDYQDCRSKSEVLLMAAIDYSVKPHIVYVANSPPRSFIKSFASRYGKKVVYIPIGQLSPITLNKLKIFHVLDGHDKREIADEYTTLY